MIAGHASEAGFRPIARRLVNKKADLLEKDRELWRAIAPRRLGQQLGGMLVRACSNWALDKPKRHSLRRSLNQTLDLFLEGAAGKEPT